jgi:hypothetical protein
LATTPEALVPKADNQDRAEDRIVRATVAMPHKNCSGMSEQLQQQPEFVAISPKSRSGASEPQSRWADEELDAEEPSEVDAPGSVTLMVRNIACRYSKEQVVGFLADLGFDGTYDFFYLPMNATPRANLGYFFINFKTEADSNRCRECLQGNCLGSSQTQKRCEVSLARVQGGESIAKHFHRKAITRSPHAPIFLGDEDH